VRVPTPEWVRVDVIEQGEYSRLCQVRVHLATGETEPPDLVLPLPGTTTGCGHVHPDDGPHPCGLGGRHRLVLQAIAATQRRGRPGEQLALL